MIDVKRNKKWLLLTGVGAMVCYALKDLTSMALFELLYGVLSSVCIIYACVNLRSCIYKFQMAGLWFYGIGCSLNLVAILCSGDQQSFAYLLIKMQVGILVVCALALMAFGVMAKQSDRQLAMVAAVSLMMFVLGGFLKSFSSGLLLVILDFICSYAPVLFVGHFGAYYFKNSGGRV